MRLRPAKGNRPPVVQHGRGRPWSEWCQGLSIRDPALAAAVGGYYLRGMATNFTPEEEVEITLLLWEYERDGSIAIDNFIRREPGLRLENGIRGAPSESATNHH